MQCQWAAGGQPQTASAVGLSWPQGTAVPCLEHLLPSPLLQQASSTVKTYTAFSCVTIYFRHILFCVHGGRNKRKFLSYIIRFMG